MYGQRIGLGASSTTGAIIGSGGAAAATITGAIIGGPIGAAVGAGISLVSTLLASIFGGRSGAEKVASTKIVNDVEPLLEQNLTAYQSGAHTVADQQAALANFDYAWSKVVQACSDPQLEQAGVNCIADRQRGSTKGYDWFSLYRDPIQNDPNVQANSFSSLLGDGGAGVLSGGGSLVPLLLIAGLALAVAS